MKHAVNFGLLGLRTGVRYFFKYLFKTVAAIISPPYCVYCKVFMLKRVPLCEECILMVRPVVSAVIPLTKKYSVKVLAISGYQDPLKGLILAKRYSNIVASRQLGELMWEMTYVQHTEFDYIVPVPLHWTRYTRRGFNQAQEMGIVIAQKSGKPMVNLLKRVKRTKLQASCSALQRAGNLKDAFELNVRDATEYEGKHLLLIDDLMTTGSTLKVAAQELVLLKPASITVLVACRVV